MAPSYFPMSTTWAVYSAIFVTLLIITILVKLKKSRFDRLPLPPGPPQLPLIGNLLDVPSNDLEGSYLDLNRKYGEIVYLNACGQSMIVLGTHEAALDLLEKRSSNYSDRLFSCMSELSGWDWLFSTLRYGPRWRKTRRLFHEHMNLHAAVRHWPIQEEQTYRYLLRILESPQDFLHHGRHLFAGIVMRVGYGIDIDKEAVDYMGIAEEAMAAFNRTFLPGKYLVESFPVLRFLPSFFPGAQFKRDAAEMLPSVLRMRDIPWAAVRSAVRSRHFVPSMASSLLERASQLTGEQAAEEEQLASNAVASAYAGGADTTLSSIQTFYIALASYPEVQKRAQDELDTVVGPHRLPTIADRNDLPYVSAIVKECFRWRPVVPLALVHLSVDEDEYKGYRIPAGSAVVVNPWAYARDPTLYPDPDVFKPERFLKEGVLNPDITDPNTMIFGYGRRVCPGRYFAEASVFAVVAAVLHTFTVSPPLDCQGQPIRLVKTVKMTPGVISYPEPYDCVIKPRSAAAEALIRASCKVPRDETVAIPQVDM